MKKGIVISVVVLLIVSLSCNAYLIFTDGNSKDESKAYVHEESSIFKLVSYERPVEKTNPITGFNYEIHKDDELNIHLYEYTRDGVRYRPLSNHQLEHVSQDLKGDIGHFLTKIEGKNYGYGYLYGPVHIVIIEIISSKYEMEIRLGTGFVTISLTEDGSERVFSIKNELDDEIDQLIAKVKAEGE